MVVSSGQLVSVLDDQLLIRESTGRASSRLVLVDRSGGRQTILEHDVMLGLSDTASLTMRVQADTSGQQTVSVLYETDGLNWYVKHSLFWDDEAGKLTSFQTTVAINNASGARFEDAALHLVSGDNQDSSGSRIIAHAAPRGGMRAFAAAASFESAGGGGAVQNVGDSTIYSLNKPTSLANDQMQVIELFGAVDVPVTKQYYVPLGGYAKTSEDDDAKIGVFTRLRLNNTQEDGMGKPIPAGTVSIFQTDAAGNVHKTGSASIEAVAAGEKFKIEFGPSTEIKAQRSLIADRDYQLEVDGNGRFYPQGSPGGPGSDRRDAARRAAVSQSGNQTVTMHEEERELTIFNYKNEAVDVKVTDFIPEHAEWVKEPEGHRFTAEGARQASTTVHVEAGKQTTLRYHVRWQR